MRKFTKEIASLLATVTVGVSANAFPASSEQFVSFTGEAMNDNVSEETVTEFAGVAMNDDNAEETVMEGVAIAVPVTTTATELPPLAGTTMTTAEETTTTTTTTTGLIGTSIPESITTTTTLPPLAGTTMTTTEETTTTTTTTTGLIGTSIPEPVTTTTSLASMVGVMAPPDGDANCDSEMDMSDAVLVMQALANPDKYGVEGTNENHITYSGVYNADFDYNGLTGSDALTIQKKLLNGEKY